MEAELFNVHRLMLISLIAKGLTIKSFNSELEDVFAWKLDGITLSLH